MKRVLLLSLAMLVLASTAFAFSSIANQVNANCPSTPFTGDCTLCHVSGDFKANTPAKTAAKASDWAFFCPPVNPNDVDDDGDGFTENQGDCNDMDASINPGATEICGDGIDNNCDGLIDGQDTMACPAPPTPTCIDADMDSYFAATPGLDCGVLDCNDMDPAINPAAAERCADGIDNNCDGLTDGQDTTACPAPPSCTDADADGFFAQAGCNTVQDCNDSDAMIFPGAPELCGDAIDNDCDGNVDEGCGMGGNEDGVTLYENNCVSCHGDLSNSDVCGEDAKEIMEAIAENEGGMSFLSSLSDDQIKSIAEALANCGQDDDGDDDHDDEKKEKKKEKKKKRSKKEHKERSDD